MATSTTLVYDLNDKRATTMLQLLLASGLFIEHKAKRGMDQALEDVAAGRVHHYSSLEDLKAKFDNVQR